MGLLSSRKKGAESPTGTRAGQFEIWGQRGWPNVDAVGESFHSREIRALLPKSDDQDAVEVTVPVTLIHNPRNVHDSNAVEIHASTGLVGHLSREDAVRYAPVLASLQQHGLTAATTARVWGSDQEDWETGKTKFVGSIRVDLPAPHMLIPANKPPASPHQILPTGSAIQVTGEEAHMPAISPYLNVSGECWVHATIHESTEVGPRSTKTLAEVRLDGNTVGHLTPKLSGDMLPTVQFLAGRGETTCVRAIVKGNSLKAEVVLHALRAHELPAAWFAGLSAPVLVPERGRQSPESPESLVPQPGGAGETAGRSGEGEALPPPLPPAAWYADPRHVARLRYWDGANWTDHTAP